MEEPLWGLRLSGLDTGEGVSVQTAAVMELIRIPSREHLWVGSATLLTLRYLNRNDFHLDLGKIQQSLTRRRETSPLQGLPGHE